MKRGKGMNNIMNGNLNLNKLQENFIEYIDCSELTSYSYKEGIQCFIKYLNNNNIINPNRNDFKGFRDSLKENMSINTINSYLTANRALFKYLKANGIYDDITKDVKSMKSSNIPVRQTLSLEQSKMIYKNLNDLREKAIFSLAITTGL